VMLRMHIAGAARTREPSQVMGRLKLRSRILLSTPRRAAWSASGPERVVVPSLSWVNARPSSQSDHRYSR